MVLEIHGFTGTQGTRPNAAPDISIMKWIILKDQQSAAFKIAVPFAILAFFVIRITVALSYRGVHNLGKVSKKDWYWLT